MPIVLNLKKQTVQECFQHQRKCSYHSTTTKSQCEKLFVFFFLDEWIFNVGSYHRNSQKPNNSAEQSIPS